MKSGENLCIVYSLAMILEETVENILDELGHDGTEKWWKLPAPYCYRGHHIQELMDLCLRRQKALVLIEVFPKSGSQLDPFNGRDIWTTEFAHRRFLRIIKRRRGILIGKASNGSGHACAWDGSSVFDPNGHKYGLDSFQVEEFWMLVAITSK